MAAGGWQLRLVAGRLVAAVAASGGWWLPSLTGTFWIEFNIQHSLHLQHDHKF